MVIFLPRWRTEVNLTLCQSAYNAFIKYGKSSSWCRSHALSFRAMSRAVSIRSQLKKYMHRFHLPVESCHGDARRLRQCLVTGYWRNGAQWCADGTYTSVHGKMVCLSPLHFFFFRARAFSHRRPCTCIPTPSCSRENPSRAGLYTTRWKKPRKDSKPGYLHTGFFCRQLRAAPEFGY